jgi:hypothetical protein
MLTNARTGITFAARIYGGIRASAVSAKPGWHRSAWGDKIMAAGLGKKMRPVDMVWQ